MIFESLEVGPLGVNCYILGCEETREGVIIDAGGNQERIIALAEQLGLNIIHVINTHGHFDHICANRAVLEHFGADLLIHAADIALLSRAAAVARSYGIPGENSPEPDVCL